MQLSFALRHSLSFSRSRACCAMHNHFSIVPFGENEQSMGTNTRTAVAAQQHSRHRTQRKRAKERKPMSVLDHIEWYAAEHLFVRSCVQPTEWESAWGIKCNEMVEERQSDWLPSCYCCFSPQVFFHRKQTTKRMAADSLRQTEWRKICGERTVILLCMRSFTQKSNEWIYSCSRSAMQ